MTKKNKRETFKRERERERENKFFLSKNISLRAFKKKKKKKRKRQQREKKRLLTLARLPTSWRFGNLIPPSEVKEFEEVRSGGGEG
jgi:hypothetical protein